jgi:hypothetical protein
MSYNFYTRPPKQLTSATWFVQPKDKDSIPQLAPMSEKDATTVEALYQQAIYAASSLGAGMESVQKKEVELEGIEYSAKIERSDGHYVVRKSLKGWFGKSHDLQRGFGEYVIEGDEDELALGPVTHVCFVIHGIGEAMFSREDVQISGIVDTITNARLAMNKRKVDEWKKRCELAKKEKLPEPEPPSRVEFIPIEWYDRIHSSSNALMKSLQAATLNTIPALRALANDVIFDVLMYMTPNFCFDVLDCVTDQIIKMHQLVHSIYPDFQQHGGKCSLIGHSLGTVICWDLLSIRKDFQIEDGKVAPSSGGVHIVKDKLSSDVGYKHYAAGEGANVAKNGCWGPSLSKPLDKCLPFVPEFTLMLGSPVGLFLTLRGAHAVFDELREQVPGDVKPRESPFTLPTGSVHNIFHPADVVAYRIEPLLLSQDASVQDLPPPVYLTRQGQDVRFHVRAKQMGQDIRKNFVDTKTSFNLLVSKAATLLQSAEVAAKSKSIEDAAATQNSAAGEPLKFPLGGTDGYRVDYQLQPKVIDNEYVAAVLAHSSYFENLDVQDAIIDLTTQQKTPEPMTAAAGTCTEDAVVIV